MDECLTTLMAKESTLVMMCATNRGEFVNSKIVAPFATMAFGSPINGDGLTKCIVRHVFLSLRKVLTGPSVVKSVGAWTSHRSAGTAPIRHRFSQRFF